MIDDWGRGVQEEERLNHGDTGNTGKKGRESRALQTSAFRNAILEREEHL